MEKFFRVTAIGDLAERSWTPENGETRNIASTEVTLSDGLDTLVAEANDDMARNLVKMRDEGKFNWDGLYRVRIKMKVVTSKDKGLKFNNIKILDMMQL